MIRILFALLVIAAQGPTLPFGFVPRSVSPPSFVTGQDCTGGSVSSGATATCSATLTASTGDEIIVGGNIGSGTATLSSCSTNSGTGTVTWAVTSSASNVHDTTEAETNGSCVGHVTAGGTVEPKMTFSASGTDGSIIAADFSGSNNTIDSSTAKLNTGSSATNGNTPGTITTGTSHDALIGVAIDTAGSTATITAGTTSVTFTKIVCTTVWGGQTCIEWGTQAAAASSTTAAWTFNNTDRNIDSIIALEP